MTDDHKHPDTGSHSHSIDPVAAELDAALIALEGIEARLEAAGLPATPELAAAVGTFAALRSIAAGIASTAGALEGMADKVSSGGLLGTLLGGRRG